MDYTRYILTLIWMMQLWACSQAGVSIVEQTDGTAPVFPDYDGVMVPCNIAPLNLSLLETGEYHLTIIGADNKIDVRSEDGAFDIPLKAWRRLLASCMDGEITMRVSRKAPEGWTAYRDIRVRVSSEAIDPYLAYRKIPPYEQWNRMGLYQRHLESFEETPIFENKMTDYGCVNCHTFNRRQPDTFLFHSRAKAPGTAYINNGIVTKLNTRTEETRGNMQYPYWHPSGRYVAASVNSTWESYYYHSDDRVEVFDTESDVFVYDMEKNEVFGSDLLASAQAYETFPTFSPDGKSLYFCTAEAVDSVAYHIEKLKYSLCRVDFDAETGTIGTKADTLFNARKEDMSISHPRISPDGRWMVVCLTRYGNFPVNHKDADLHIIDLGTGTMRPLEGANSELADSYHSWGGNSHWMVFSSRRIDGYYSRPYITYIDEQGKAGKPFLLPQRNPAKFYNDQMMSYNLPELIEGRVKASQRKIALTLRNTGGQNMSFRQQAQ